MTFSEESRQSGAPGGEPSGSGRSKGKIGLWIVLILVLLAIPTYFFLKRLDRMNRRMARLSTQVEQGNENAAAASARAAAALDRASQAQVSAQEAARERDQAEKAKAASEQQAQQAFEQVQTAQQKAAAAQQAAAAAQAKAEEYRKEREAEIAHLQKVLSQITQTRRTAMGLVMTLGSKSIRFAFDKSTLQPEDKEVLSRIAGVLSTVEGFGIYIYGYTDDIGTKEYNLGLSERRAKAVRDYLVANGLDPSIITTKGYGKADPLVPGSSPKARAINRRVEIGLVDSTIKPLPPQNQ
ncbi:MAG TPA: OmpA family protein [Terriglobia bacterium]|nr:OmpA family protein [Terriglobia bacterium]